MTESSLIQAVLLSPPSCARLSALEWDLLIRQGRSANLLARLCEVLDNAGQLAKMPPAPQTHLLSARSIAERQRIATRWEIECIRKAVAGATDRLILLKGAAYLASGLPVSASRLFSDVDVLVRRNELPEVESALIMHGWQGDDKSEYDQNYYRQWMHEIPPMHHTRRGTSIDVHHSILPETARVKVNTTALFDAAVPVDGHEGVFVLRPAEMLLHSATHLFHEGEFDNALRDLFDLDALIRHFSTDSTFWPTLLERADILSLQRPLYYALRYAHRLLGTAVPDSVLTAIARFAPGPLQMRLMDFCYSHALCPVHSSIDDSAHRTARFLLYLRSHWMRMPVHLLIYHLSRRR